MKYIVSDCSVVDVENNGVILPNRDIFVNGKTIEKILPHGKSPKGYRVVKAGGMYAVPGLINLHVHLFGTGRPSKALGGGKAQQRLLRFIQSRLGKHILSKMVGASAKNQLYSGVTTLRCVGDLFGSDIALKRRTDAGKGGARGLRMFASGMAITVLGGHGAGTFARTADTVEGLERLVDEAVSAGADFIKICITGGVMDAKKRGEPGEVKMDLEQVRAVCARAHACGKKVAAHVQSERGAEIAAVGGVDTVEHGAPLSEAAMRILCERQGAQVVTCTPALPNARLPHEVTKLNEMAAYNSEVVMQGMLAGAKQAMEAGLSVGMGTDSSCPFCTQYNMWREVVWYRKMTGVSAADALAAATLGNAKILGIGDLTGSLCAGKSADILLLSENPLNDLSALQRIEGMFAQGRYIAHPCPRRIPAIEAELDKLTEEL